MSGMGLHIVDPRILSDQVGDDDSDADHHHHHLHSILPSPPLTVSLSAPPRTSSRPSVMSSNTSSSSSSLSQETDNLYSNLATFTFGEAHTSDPTYSSSYDSDDEGLNAISPLTSIHRSGTDRTPRPSVSTSTSTSPKQISSHPSQGPGRQSSNPFPSSSRSSRRAIEHTDEESGKVPSPDLITRHRYPHRSNDVPDNASQTTFGHLPVRSSIAFSSNSRSSSRASSHDGLEFSSDDEVEIYYDGGSSPVTFARDLDDIDEDAPAFHRHLFETRRGSFPMPIPGTSSDALSNRSREGSILTIRRPSRSLGDDIASHMSSHSGEDPATVIPRSEPLTRADFRSLEVLATQQQLDNPPSDRGGGVYDGFDLAYVYSRGSEGSIRSFQPSFMSPGRTSTSDPSSLRLSSTWGRRTSTVTLQTTGSGGGEDSFLRHVGLYGSRSDQWSFLKEKADGPSASGVPSARHGRSSSLVPPPIVVDKAKQTMLPGAQEIWRSGHVGRYKVDRLAFKPATADPTKAAQQRINVRHIQDPFINLKGTKPGGPSSVIHKHSRAIAFSIFRSYNLFQSKRGGTMSLQSGSRNIHMHTSGGIMLAPKKVQEQYTSTKTTSKLSTHGLLEDGSRKSTVSADKSRRGKEKEDAKKSKAKDKKKDKDKKNERASHPTESTESSATSSTGSVTPSGASQIISAPVRAAPSMITFANPTKTIIKLQPASGPSSPEMSTPDHSAKKPLESDDSSPVSVVSHNFGHRGSIDSDERLPMRTPHAEAFGTLDPNDIEHLRRAQKPSDGSSSFYRIFRRFRPVSSRPDSNSSPPAVTPQNAYSPPWIVTTGRDQNEEQVRVLADLNNSFRDVGLLHTQPHKTGFKSTSKKRTGHDIFDYVPEDSLYMLLPLWAGETDSSTNSSTQPPTLPTVPEDRQYLLVWYVPFESDKGKKPEQQQHASTKKKVKQSNSNPDSTSDTNQKNMYITHFRVNARLVGYDDLRGSGIRLPSDGLAVTAPAWEAVSYNNVDAARSVMQMSETTICVCSSREKGFQFQPEGLTKLGLCSHEEVVAPPLLPLQPHMYEYEQGGEVEPYLTPIGRAAVEMVWLGCLAITSFGPA